MHIKNICRQLPLATHQKLMVNCIERQILMHKLTRVLLYNYLYEMPRLVQKIIEERAVEFGIDEAFCYLEDLNPHSALQNVA